MQQNCSSAASEPSSERLLALGLGVVGRYFERTNLTLQEFLGVIGEAEQLVRRKNASL